MTKPKKNMPLVAIALAAALLALGSTYYRNTRLKRENERLGRVTAKLSKEAASAQAGQATWRTNAVRLEARLTEASAALAAAPQRTQAQEQVHEKLRAEIARLSEETMRGGASLTALRETEKSLRESKGKTEGQLREAQSALATAQGELTRLRASEADKTTRLAAREQELATAKSDLAAATKTSQEALAAKTAAEGKVQALQAQSGADQAELARLKQRVAELEAEKAKPPTPAPAPAGTPSS
jgi:chromosome segregation ATPase